jgi:8-oxo-dGTP pyrophosphatase MutT (NUDIX family)
VSTNREEIARTVASIVAADALETGHQAAALEWIDSGDQLYRLVPPDHPPMHLVTYFVPFDTAEGSMLLTAHRKSGLDLPPGGHCENGELPWQTVERECREELGVPAIPLPWLGTTPLFVTVTETQGSAVRRHTDVSLWYVVEIELANQQLDPDPGEFDGVRWSSFDALLSGPKERLDPHMHRFVRKLRAASRGIA